MALIDFTYFINEIDIPSNILGVDNFTTVIDRYEPQCLIDMLGNELYESMLNDLDGSGNPQSQNFINLIDGVEYMVGGKKYYWGGLRRTSKVSPISLFIYWIYRTENDSIFAASGRQVVSKMENSESVSNINKLVGIYNKYILLRDDAYFFLNSNINDYLALDFTFKDKINRLDI